MNETMTPSVEDMWDELLELVDETTLSEKAFSRIVREVYKREEDNTFWAVNYSKSHTGDYNEMRDNPEDIKVVRVYPRLVSTTVFGESE